MASTEPRLAHYHFRVCRTDQQQRRHHRQVQYVKPNDTFVFEVEGGLRILSTDSTSHRCETLFQTSISITCERFFGDDNHDFLLSRHITNQPYFPPEHLDDITQRIKRKVQQLHFALDATGFSKPSDSSSEPQEFHLTLDIVVDEVNDDLLEAATMEEFMQHDGMMIPASNEAIKSLKTYKLPDQCPICMEKFYGDDDDDDDDDDDVEFTPLPCGHGFHHGCILQWLQTNHTCPMCRYPLPTANN